MPRRRVETTREVFSKLDPARRGVLRAEALAAVYQGNLRHHPDVMNGKRGAAEVMGAFAGLCNGAKDGWVTWGDFLAHHARVSHAIPGDDYFDLLMRNAFYSAPPLPPAATRDPDGSLIPPARPGTPGSAPADPLMLVRARIIEASGSDGFRGLSRTFRMMNDARDHKLTKRELYDGMASFGVSLTPAELDAIYRKFDRTGQGHITLTDFLRAVRGVMGTRRQEITKLAFQRLDQDGDGVASFAELRGIYGANLCRHPDVVQKKKTEDEVMREFLAAWWDKTGDGNVTLDEFLEYYTDLSTSIDHDDYYELMIRNAWRISGGEGWCENTACRRVLVEYMDGHLDTVEEIKDDLGIGPNDTEKMIANLEAQGITGIKRIKRFM